MSLGRHALLAALAMGALAGPNGPGVAGQDGFTRFLSGRRMREQVTTLYAPSWATRKRGPGWTHAHVQRMAKKARNKFRNRKAHR